METDNLGRVLTEATIENTAAWYGALARGEDMRRYSEEEVAGFLR